MELSYELFGLLRSTRFRKKLLLLSVAIVLVIVFNAAAQVRLNVWQGTIYDAIGQRDLSVFYRQIAIFAAITSVLLVLGVSQTWLNERLKVALREAVSVDVLDEWLRPARLSPAAHRRHRQPSRPANPGRRAPPYRAHGRSRRRSGAILAPPRQLHRRALGAVVADRLYRRRQQLFNPGYLVWCALAYAAVGSFLVWLVGRPLIQANTELRAREAEFRFLLVRVDDKAEAIAIHRGEADERYHLGAALDTVLAIMRRIANGLANLTWVSASYGWIGLIAPIVLAAPGYFAGTLSLGGLIMVVGAFYQVQQALRWYVDRFPALAEWNAALLRVMAYRRALIHCETLGQKQSHIVYSERAEAKLVLDDLCVVGPAGRIALAEPHLEVGPGERVLISGTPKSGKTTFFRALAGLWPWGSGAIATPRGKVVMFLPHRPYLPLGSLREVLTYPSEPEVFSQAALDAVLHRIRLNRLIPALDKIVRWDQELTLDEQQRLAIGRALLHKPDWIVNDEAMSELDDDNRALVKSLFGKELAGTALISIGRHTDDGGFYQRIVHLSVTSRDETVPDRSTFDLHQGVTAVSP